jgi:gamma-glutamyltranspeptidase/glutathione hydrolase
MNIRAAQFLWMVVLSCLGPLSSPAIAQQVTDNYAPEAGSAGQSSFASNDSETKSRHAQEFIVVAAHPEASQAGYDVLSQGGNAIDAMVAVQAVLGLVEPQSSGLGGGAFLLYYDAAKRQLTTFDGRETAPQRAPDDLFIGPDKTPMQFFDAVVGGRSVGTPGTVKLLSDVHGRFGSRAWSTLLAPAIELARNGFNVTPRLARAVANDAIYLQRDPEAAHYFFPKGEAIQTGQNLKNPAYAKTLVMLAKQGGDAFYDKENARTISDKVRRSANPGYLSIDDFADYRVVERAAVCSDYQQYEVCGMGPPSSGAVSVNQTLGILEPLSLRDKEPESALAWQLVAEASRLAFADRGLYLADPDFVAPAKGLLDPAYLRSRAALITPNKAAAEVSAGRPTSDSARYVQGVSPAQASTTHFVIVDKQGNIVSMTSTIENGFGSRLMVNGFLLNNELTDFSFTSQNQKGLIANRVEAGKRPRSSMAPTIVFKKGEGVVREPFLALGSPGGSRIINYVANSLIRILDWGFTLQQAFDAPHIVNRFGVMDIESGSKAEALNSEFQNMGYQTSVRGLNSGLHGVKFEKAGMVGAADRRREGGVMGR